MKLPDKEPTEGLKALKRYRHIPTAMDYDIIEKDLRTLQEHEEILKNYNLNLCDFREACLLLAMLKGENLNIHDIAKRLKVLEILKAFDFEIEDYTEDENGSIKVKYHRIILDNEEIDIAKEVLL